MHVILRKCKQKRKRKLDEHELAETPRLTFNWMEEKDEESSEQEEVGQEYTAVTPQSAVGQEHMAVTAQSAVEREHMVQSVVGQEHTVQSAVGQEHTVQGEVEHLPPTTDIVAVHTSAAWEDTEAKCKDYVCTFSP